MKKLFFVVIAITLLTSCNNNNSKKLTVVGEIKNAYNQKIYLEQLFFSDKNPEVVDTANIANGKFSVSALAPEEGIYRLRLEKQNAAFIFINDQNAIGFSADLKNPSLDGPTFNSPANQSLKNFIAHISSAQQDIAINTMHLQDVKSLKPVNDSIVTVVTKEVDGSNKAYAQYIANFIDTVSNATAALFAVGYTRTVDPMLLEKPIANLVRRFPKNETIATVANQFTQLLAQYKATPNSGKAAPDFTMNDVNGNTVSLKSFKGKYVLIDFWASWCAPCREENPNVVKAFNAFKDKNFTVLSVSLDKDKDAWMKAITSDNLTWTNVCDFQSWNSSVVNLYGFQGIPYNVLIDPSGQIIATELRGEELQKKLSEVLK